MIMKKLIVVLFAIAAGRSAQAQEHPLTLEEAIAIALQNNYDIQIARNDSTVAAINESYGKYLFFPTVNAQGSLIVNNSRQLQELKNGTTRGGKVQQTTINSSVNLNWVLFDGFRMFIARERLDQLIRVGELQIRNQVVTTVSDVMRNYYGIVRQQEQIKALQEGIALASDRLRIAQYKFDIGTGVKPDVLQAQIDVNSQRTNLLAQQAQLDVYRAQLGYLFNNGQPVPVTVADTIITFNNNITLDSARSGLDQVNPRLQLGRENIRLAELTLREARASRWPTVSFTSAYNFNRAKSGSVVNEITQPVLNRNSGLNYGLTATIPLFNGFSVRRNIQLAQTEIRFQELTYARDLSNIQVGISAAYLSYDASRRALRLEEQNLLLVRENLAIVRERYRLGVTNFIELRTAEQNLSDAQFRIIQARYNTKLAEIQVMQLRGDIIR
ncbi:MAG: TolC family protein [Sphingobacteriales bacterium]|nr:MAG: TolC family protein [Sphingobacteriales bacterium]